VAVGNTLGRTPSQSAYSSLQSHQLGNGITPPLRACASSRPPRRTSRDWRLVFGDDGCLLGFECGPLGWTILRYVTHSNGCAASVLQSQLIGLKCWMGVRSAETLSQSHDVRRRGTTQCWRKIWSVAPYVRPFARRVPLAISGCARSDRGRDAGHPAPPAQIRTGPIKASGSYLGCLAANRTLGHGWRILGLGRKSLASFFIRSHRVPSF
jgi:hypothetical protein